VAYSEVLPVEPTARNARRIVELTREVYDRSGNYTPQQLDQIADPDSIEAIRLRLARLKVQGKVPLRQYYDGIFNRGNLSGFVMSAVWDDEDEAPFSSEIDRGEYYSDTNRVFGLHVIALTQDALGRGYGTQLFDYAAHRYPNSTIKTAVDERDEHLKIFMERNRMTDTGRLGAVALGASGIESVHRLFMTQIDQNGKVASRSR